MISIFFRPWWIFMEREFASVKCKENECSEILDLSPSWIRPQLSGNFEWLCSPLPSTSLSSLNFPFASGTRNHSIVRAESTSVNFFLFVCKSALKTYSRQKPKLCIENKAYSISLHVASNLTSYMDASKWERRMLIK